MMMNTKNNWHLQDLTRFLPLQNVNILVSYFPAERSEHQTSPFSTRDSPLTGSSLGSASPDSLCNKT